MKINIHIQIEFLFFILFYKSAFNWYSLKINNKFWVLTNCGYITFTACLDFHINQIPHKSGNQSFNLASYFSSNKFQLEGIISALQIL